MTKSLAEAAAEILNGSRASAAKEPMHTSGATPDGSGLGSVQDLGGSTNADPMGNVDIGSKAAAGTPSATPPGTPPDAKSKETHFINKSSSVAQAQAVSNQKAGEKESPDSIASNDQEDKLVSHNNGLDQPTVSAPGSTSEEVDLEAARKQRWEEIKSEIAKMSVKEDVDAMLSGQNLSEEFKTKVTTIFEAAVLSRAVAVAERLEAQIIEDAEQAIEEVRTELEEKVDSYLNYVVENWVKENEVAIESGLKSEIIEGFLHGLKNLFTENYVEIPDDKLDILEAKTAEAEELKNKLNEALEQNIALAKQINAGKKSEILNKVCEGLTAVQAEKVKTLAESVEFSTDADYTKKVGMIRESYFPTTVKQDATTQTVALTESESPAQVTEETFVDPAMAHYVAALNRFQK